MNAGLNEKAKFFRTLFFVLQNVHQVLDVAGSVFESLDFGQFCFCWNVWNMASQDIVR